MANTVYTTNQSGTLASTPTVTHTGGDNVLVFEGVLISATGTGSPAISVTAGAVGTITDIALQGTLYSAETRAIVSSGTLRLNISEEGSILGHGGVSAVGAFNQIENSGQISVNASNAIFLGNSGGSGSNLINNYGHISNQQQSSGVASTTVYITGANNSLYNSGDIRGPGGAVDFDSSTGGNVLTNLGTISSGFFYGVNVSGSGNQVDNAAGATIISTGYRALGLFGSGNQLNNAGSIVTQDSAELALAAGADLSLNNSGTITGGGAGVSLGTGGEIVNSGRIDGQAAAIVAGGALVLSNDSTGRIRGDIGLQIDQGNNRITNDGAITGMNGAAITINNTTGGQTEDIQNHGVIERIGGSGNAIVVAGSGAVALVNTGTVAGTIALGSGNDSVDTQLGRVEGTIFTGDGNDTLLGSDSSGDRLSGGDGDDLLEGNAGNDILFGGAGADELNGGTGTDTVSYTNAGNGVSVDLSAPTSNTGDATGDSYASVENLTGSNFEDTLSGDNLANRLIGGDGHDSLSGRLGDDRLDGGTGADTLIGGGGNDVYLFDNVMDSAVELAGEGTDRILTTVSASLGAGQSIEQLVAMSSANIDLFGNELDNILVGNSADNVLDGGLGKDTMRGGLGNDVYRVNQADDAAIERAGEGTDTVESTITRTLGSFQENLVLTGLTNINGIGNELANQLTGNDGNNTLNGKEGADTLTGGLGNDIFAFNAGMADGDTVADFAGNGAAAGDSLRFVGYGTAAEGATFVQLDATTWQINSADNFFHDTITLVGAPGIDASDFAFI